METIVYLRTFSEMEEALTYKVKQWVEIKKFECKWFVCQVPSFFTDNNIYLFIVEYKNKDEEKTLDIPEHLINNFTAFVEYRKASKKPMTEHAQKLLLENVLKLWKTEAQQNKILEKSIMNWWQWIFPLKEEECCDDPIIFKKMYDNGNIDMLKKNLWLDRYFELKSSLPIL